QALHPQCALLAGVFGVLVLGFSRSPCTGMARALGVLALAAAGLLGLNRAHAWDPIFLVGAALLLMTLRGRGETAPALVLASVLGMIVLAAADSLFLLF